jgi:hypothetical protein
VRGRGDVPQGCQLVGVRCSLAGVPDARDRQRVEAGAGQLADEGGGVTRAGGVVDDTDRQLVACSGPASGEQEQRSEESASTNGPVLTGNPTLKLKAGSRSRRSRCRSASTVQAAVDDLSR